MKKFKTILVTLFAFLMISPCVMVSYAEYDVTVNPINNLATSKYDWMTDNVGSGAANFSDGGMRMENFQSGSAIYALYQTEKFNEVKYSMYAKLNLTKPSDFGMDNNFDYSNLYISFMINTDSPSAAYCCPWNGGRAYFSLCFENLQGHDKTVLFLNEGFVGSGETRRIVKEVTDNTKSQWNDGEYHWFEFEFTNATRTEEYRGQQREFTGKLFKYYFDGELCLEYFQRDQEVRSDYLDKNVDYDFSGTSGYLGFWPSSDFPVSAGTSQTDCYVDIEKIQITSLDNGNETPFEQCEVPEFDVTSVNFSPEASYETGEPVEIRLSSLFEYEGDEPLVYTVTSGGSAIGEVRNGFWIWTPETAGTYYVDVKAEVGDKTATNYLTLRAVAASVTPGGGGGEEEGGCNSSISAIATAGVLPLALAFVLIRRKSRG